MKKRTTPIRLNENQLYELVEDIINELENGEWDEFAHEGTIPRVNDDDAYNGSLPWQTLLNAVEKRAKQADKYRKGGFEALKKFKADKNGKDADKYSQQSKDLFNKHSKATGSSLGLKKSAEDILNRKYGGGYKRYNYMLQGDSQILPDFQDELEETSPDDMKDYLRHKAYFDNRMKIWLYPGDKGYNYDAQEEFWKNQLGESVIRRITENVIRKLNEGINDDNEDNHTMRKLSLLIDNDIECQKLVQWLVQALVKKVSRGLVPELEYLADCSTVRKIFQMGMRKLKAEAIKYKDPISNLSPDKKREVRLYIAQCILDDVEYETNNSAE